MDERTEKGRGALMTHHHSLRSLLIIRNILPALRPILTGVEYSRVDGKEDNVAQVDEFIRILLTKEFRHFETFCTVLANNGYEHWAKTLREEVREDVHIWSEVHPGKSLSEPTRMNLPQESPSAIRKKHTIGKHASTIVHLPSMPCKLQVISCVLFQNKVYVTGIATDEDALSRQVQMYSLDDRMWSTLPTAPNYNAPAAIINGHFTLIGGRLTKDGTITSILSSWIEKVLNWEQRLPPMPMVRLESGVCHHDNLLLVTGGIVDDKEQKLVNTVDVYDFAKPWSTPKALELPKALRSHHVVVFEEYLYLVAGATEYPARPEGNEQRFNSAAWRARWCDVMAVITQPSMLTNVWTPIIAPHALRPTVATCGNSLLAVGGVKDGEPQEDIYELVSDVIGRVKNWKPVGRMSVGKYRHGAVLLGSRGAAVFAVGGYVEGSQKEDETNKKSCLVEVVQL